MKETISDAVYNLACTLIDQNFEFAIQIHNGNDWDKELPDRLKSQKGFLLKLDGDTLADIEFDDNDNFIVSTEFDDELYTKTFGPADVQAIYGIDLKPLLVKNFVEAHPMPEPKRQPSEVSLTNKREPDSEGLRVSMEMFKKYNPDLF